MKTFSVVSTNAIKRLARFAAFVLLIMLCTNQTLFAQEEDESEIGVELTGQEYRDNYETEILFEMDSIVIYVHTEVGVEELTYGETYVMTIDLENSMADQAKLVEIISACACISNEWYKQPIAAGAMGFVKVKYTASIIGLSQKVFTAIYSDPASHKPIAKRRVIFVAETGEPTLSN